MEPNAYPTQSVFSGFVPAEPNGVGTLETPYLIGDANELGTIWYRPLAHYRLTSEIDLSGIDWSNAIVPWFDGRFDGNGYCIRSLQMQGAALGLFGALGYGGEVMNLGVEDVNVTGTGNSIGSLVAFNYGRISFCHSTGTVSGISDVGGLVGDSWTGSRISSCYSNCTVIGDEHVGGLLGSNWGIVRSSYSSGPVNGQWYVGGLTGSSWYRANIHSCYNTGAVTGIGHIGGLAGHNGALGGVYACYSTGRVTGDEVLGGLVAFNDGGHIVYSFWDRQTSGLSQSAAGTGKTTSQMQNINTYLNEHWDFVNETDNGTDEIWFMPENDYPKLWWQAIE